MVFTADRPIVLWMAALAAVLLVAGYAALQLPGRFSNGPHQTETPAPPIRPPGAEDLSNPGILIRGGALARRGDRAAADTFQAGPYSTADEGMAGRTVASFWMQQHEVTNEEFRRYDAGHQFADGQERHPVINVTWRQAMDYATSIGGILPTEAQWEFAARGSDGRKYPWGKSEPTCEEAQFRDCNPGGTIEVMSRPRGATPDGIHDLAGNVWEWVMPNWFEPGRTPVNDASRRLRGGSFLDDAFFLRGSNRNNDFFEGFKYVSVGFRVVWPTDR